MPFSKVIAYGSSLWHIRKGGRPRQSKVRSDPFDRGLDSRKHAAHLVEDSDRRRVDPLERDDGTTWLWRGGV